MASTPFAASQRRNSDAQHAARRTCGHITRAAGAKMESHLVNSCTDANADDVNLASAQQASSKRAKSAAPASGQSVQGRRQSCLK